MWVPTPPLRRLGLWGIPGVNYCGADRLAASASEGLCWQRAGTGEARAPGNLRVRPGSPSSIQPATELCSLREPPAQRSQGRGLETTPRLVGKARELPGRPLPRPPMSLQEHREDRGRSLWHRQNLNSWPVFARQAFSLLSGLPDLSR